MPAYRSDHWQWWTGRLSAARGSRGAGVLARAVLLTVRADLGDGSLDRPGSEDFAAQQWDIDRSDAFGQRANGRLALHRLGAWPWALCAAGRLPHGWSGRAALARLEQPGDEFVEALWHWAGSLLARQARDVRRVAATLN